MDLFLLILAGIWLVIASLQDIKKREIANWLNFSLITFALSYRAIYSVFNSDLMFFVYGLAGFLLFFILAYAFYYSRIFAGGDAKLLMGLGTILPFYNSITSNLIVFGVFIFLLLLAGSVYGLLYSFFLVIKNPERFVNEFNKQFKLRKKLFLIGLMFAGLSLVFVFYFKEAIFAVLPLLILLFPILFIYGKAVENSCMIVEIPGNKATVGDWLYEKVKVRGKIVKPYWEGLDEKEVKLLSKVKKIKIKQGIPFVPSFLIAFILLVLFGDYVISLFLSI